MREGNRGGKGKDAYLTTRKHQFPTKNLRTILHQPFRSVVAVFCASGPRVFGCEPVSD